MDTKKVQKEKMVIYQVFPRWFGNTNAGLVRNGNIYDNGVGKFSFFTIKALEKIKELGITHIWYTGIIEHATKTDYTYYHIPRDHSSVVKGNAGSPYAIKDYYDVDPDLADSVPNRMEEFEALVRRTHEAGLKVIIDFVPNHVARQYHSDVRPAYVNDLGQSDNTSKAFDPDNNFYYFPGQVLTLSFGSKGDYEHYEYSEFPGKVTGNDCFNTHPGRNDWYETVKLNYGVDYQNGGAKYFNPIPNTWLKMRDILQFWASKGIDGFRCDMAFMVPIEFWEWVIPIIKQEHEVCFIAEIYNPNEYRDFIYRGHFDYLYDKVGLYDTLRNVMCERQNASDISHCWQSLGGIQEHMLNFIENHDEQRIASDFFAGNPWPGIPGLVVAALMNTNPVMIYSGQELGEPGMDDEGFSGKDGKTSIFDYWSLRSLRNWINKGAFDGAFLSSEQRLLRDLYCRILNIARKEPAVVNGAFYDLMYVNEKNPYFNTHHQYAFLRKYQNDVLLIVANFDRAEQKVRVEIPADAFSNMGFQSNRAAKATDLLTGHTTISTLTDAWPYQLIVPGCSMRIIKFEY